MRAVDAACVAFALWTLACHAASFSGASLWAALAGFGALAVSVLAWRLSPAGRARAAPPAEASSGAPDAPPALRWAGAAVGVGVAWLLRDHPLALWWASIAMLGAAAGLAPGGDRSGAPAAESRLLESGLWALSLSCVVVALVSHRSDLDDAFYVNLALAAAEAPGLPVLAGDSLHGVPGLPIHMPVYRVHSWELWNAALARLTGLPTIAVFHCASAAAVAALAPLAWARLLRLLSPRDWLAAAAATLWVLLVSADAHRWYANFGLVRIWQGKAVVLMVLLPLVQAYAIAFVQRPSPRRFLLLAAGQVAAVGASSTALWLGPASALAAGACAAPISRRGLLRLGLVLGSSVYVLGLGLVVKAEMDAERRDSRPPAASGSGPIGSPPAASGSGPVGSPPAASGSGPVGSPPAASGSGPVGSPPAETDPHAPGVRLAEGIDSVTGDGPLRVATWGALLVTGLALPPGPGRRFAIGVPLAVIAVLLNPHGSRWLSENLIGPSTWRAFWALPVPVLLGLLLTAPRSWGQPGRRWGTAAAAAAALLFALTVPRQATLGEGNGVTLRSPGLKVPEEAYALARTFARTASPGAFVVAPSAVSVWLPTLRPRTYPLVVRGLYLRPYRRQLGERDLRWRVLMTRYTEGRAAAPTAPGWFQAGLEHFDVQAVFLWSTPEAGRARRLLVRGGFRRERSDPEWEIWVRD